MRLVPSRPRSQSLSRRIAIGVAVLLTCAVPAAVAMRPVPLDWKHTVGDPSVVKTTKKYVVIATGAKVNRGLSKNGKVWKWKSSALPTLPTWANPYGGDIWAADMEKIGSRYVLYFAAPVKGKTGTSRCIGVATSTSAKGTFVPVAGPPLVCPNTFSKVPAAADGIVDEAQYQAYTEASAKQSQAAAEWSSCEDAFHSATQSPTPSPITDSPSPTDTTSPTASTSPTGPSSPAGSPSVSDSPTGSESPSPQGPTARPDLCGPSPSAVAPPTTADDVIGAIDPSFFLDSDGTPYLLYKTDRHNSIRLLQLSPDGLTPAADAVSQELVRSTGVLENPVMVKRGGIYYLFDSYGDYARCSYSTVWRASASLRDWSASPAHSLLTRKSTHKLCGPGGADILLQGNKVLTYFEAWTCKHSWKPCGHKFWSFSSTWQHKHPVRALYAAKLGFRNGAPYVKKYLKGSKH